MLALVLDDVHVNTRGRTKTLRITVTDRHRQYPDIGLQQPLYAVDRPRYRNGGTSIPLPRVIGPEWLGY